MNMVNFVIAVIDNSTIEMLKDIYEKSKLAERSGRKAANLSLLCKGGYGGRVAMEENASVMPIFLARNIQSGGYCGASKIYFKKEQSFLPAHYYWIVVPRFWAIHAFFPGEGPCGPDYPCMGCVRWGCRL
jgi:hypothetical protein